MKAYDDQELREKKAYENFQHVKRSEAPVCKKCGMPMLAKIRPEGIRWRCMNVLGGCYHSFLEGE